MHLESKIKYEEETREKTVEQYAADEDVKVELAEGVEDLDREDLEDPLMVAEYVVEIFEYLKKLEVSTRPNANYMEHQDDLEWKMRGILIDWLIEVHTRFLQGRST